VQAVAVAGVIAGVKELYHPGAMASTAGGRRRGESAAGGSEELDEETDERAVSVTRDPDTPTLDHQGAADSAVLSGEILGCEYRTELRRAEPQLVPRARPTPEG
jgi:hypothetical protein